MRPLLAQSQLALAAVAILGVIVVLIVVTRRHSAPVAVMPTPVGLYRARARPGGAVSLGARTACGVVVQAATEGVSSPVLPCGMRLFVDYGGTRILATVIGRSDGLSPAEFDLTPALAARLGITSLRQIEWSYVVSP